MAILIMVIAAAIVTPGPDVFSQLALAVPMVGLYELGLILIKSNKKAPAHAMLFMNASTYGPAAAP